MGSPDAQKERAVKQTAGMIVFVLIFIVLYSGMHLYAFYKIKAAIPLAGWCRQSIILFMMLMVLSPLLVRQFEKAGMEFLARMLSWAGFTWMGILFLFDFFSLATDLTCIFVRLAGSIFKSNLSAVKLSPGHAFSLSLLLTAGLALYGYFDARKIRTERVVIRTSAIPRRPGRLRIVQISDVHLGMMVREERLKSILSAVKKVDPDILVSTGDLVDGMMMNIEELIRPLKEITPRYGKFAVTGNHEFYAGPGRSVEFIERAGFKVLRGEGVSVQGLINIAGVDDRAGRYTGWLREVSEAELLSSLPRNRFTLFLKHTPRITEESLGLFDLQLSGHTHHGQIFPFNLITRLLFSINSGMRRLPKGSLLYVSRGTGTWGPPMRIFAPPEVTLIELLYQEKGKNE